MNGSPKTRRRQPHLRLFLHLKVHLSLHLHLLPLLHLTRPPVP
jgi:hypothetical protein